MIDALSHSNWRLIEPFLVCMMTHNMYKWEMQLSILEKQAIVYSSLYPTCVSQKQLKSARALGPHPIEDGDLSTQTGGYTRPTFEQSTQPSQGIKYKHIQIVGYNMQEDNISRIKLLRQYPTVNVSVHK